LNLVTVRSTTAGAEADGNRTRLAGIPGHSDFEDQEGHQAPKRLHATAYETTSFARSQRRENRLCNTRFVRLTGYAHGGGCACKIPPGELELMLAGLTGAPSLPLLVGFDEGDDAAAVRLDGNGTAVLSTVDFFTPVVDDAYDWGRIAAANALSDIYAMGGRPILAVNLLCWPIALLPLELATEVLRGGLDVATAADCPLAGGHSIDDPEPKYGLAVTGVAPADRLLRNNAGVPGLPISLTKPLGLGVLNSRHKQTGAVFPEAVDTMARLNRDAADAALNAGVHCVTDVTGFGLLGHLYKLARASNVTAVIDADAVPYLEGARDALRDGYVSGGTRRNLAWVDPHVGWSGRAETDEGERLLLADAQTSGGLLICGEVPGAPVIGELRPRGEHVIEVR
jgi:selenide, water dikinase